MIKSETRAFQPHIQGLRGVAVALVLAYHLGFVSGGFIGWMCFW